MTTPESKPISEAKPAVKAVEAKPAAQPVNISRLIRCLEEVEGGQWNWPGGKLRITRALWHDFGKSSYIHSCDPTKAREVATKALSKYSEDIIHSGHEASVKLLARCWNAGWNGAMHDPKATSDYSDRVANLYYDPSFKEEV